MPPVGAMAGHCRVDDRKCRRKVHQEVCRDVRGIGANHLGNGAEQRGKTPVIRVGKAGDAPRKDHAHVRVGPGGRDTSPRQHARVRHARRGGGRTEIHHLIKAPTTTATGEPSGVRQRLNAAMTTVAVSDRERGGHQYVATAALEQQVDELLDHRRGHRRRLGQPGQYDGATTQSRRDGFQCFGERARDFATPDNATGDGRLMRGRRRHPSMKPADGAMQQPGQGSLTAWRV